MKKTIRTGIFLLLLFSCASSFSQENANTQNKLKAAKLLLEKGTKNYNPPAALSTYRELASQGNPEAMNALGIIYSQGTVTQANESIALEWLEKAAQSGYAKAYYNMALLYKNRTGVLKDEAKAVHYFEKAAKAGYNYAFFYWGQMTSKGLGTPQNYALAMSIWKQGGDLGIQDCIFGQGYLHYKGFGTVQDYKKAIELFQLAADKGGSAGMYMLGLSYRNGYGTAIDPAKADYWLRKSASLGYKNASIELQTPSAENAAPNQNTTVSAPAETVNTLTEGTAPEKFQNVNQKTIQGDISGVYTGHLIRYDWSGQNIISRTPLEMTLDQKGKILSGIWKEKEGDQAQFKAEITSDAIVFENSKIDRIEHFSNNMPKTYEFKQARVQYLEKDNAVYIAGNIQLYDFKEHENEKPMYLSLQRNTPAADDQTQHILSQLIVYPNPVTLDTFNLSFELAEHTDISIDIYSFTGFLVNQQKLKTLDSGHQELAIPFNAPPGNYILNLKYGAKMIKTILIKK